MRFWRVPAGIALGILLGVVLFQYQFGGKFLGNSKNVACLDDCLATPHTCVPIDMHYQNVYVNGDSAAMLSNFPHDWGISPFFGYSCQGSDQPNACTSGDDQVIHFPFRSTGNGVAHINVVFDNFFSKLELDGTVIAEMTTAGVVTLNNAFVVWPSSGATGNFTNIAVGTINTSNNFGVNVVAGEHEFKVTGKNFTGPFGATILSTCGAPPPPNTCGDGVPGGANEQCDDGNSINDDMCNNACQAARCGDFITQTIIGETCDDANTNNTDGCDNQCHVGGRCGDGISGNTAGEECDDGNTLSLDGCRGDCRIEGTPTGCVDATIQQVGAMGCDQNNVCGSPSAVSDQCSLGTSTAPRPLFSTSFTAPPLSAPLHTSCSILLRGQVDDFLGNIQVNNAQKFPCTTTTDCPFNFSSNRSCVNGSCYFAAFNSQSCQQTLVANFPVSNGSNQTLTASYMNDDTVAFAHMNAVLRCCNLCGNGQTDPGEECDRGSLNNNFGSCTRACKTMTCGDGFRQEWGLDNNVNTTADNEECDPLAAPWNAAPKLGTCINNSPIICKEARCGDGLTQALGKDGLVGGGDDEQCDDGDGTAASISHSTGINGSTGSSCSTSCQWINVCGNGRIDAGGPDGNPQTNPAENETCDDGAALNIPSALANKPWTALTDADIAILSRSKCINTCRVAQCGDAIDNDTNGVTDFYDGACRAGSYGAAEGAFAQGYNIENCPFCEINAQPAVDDGAVVPIPPPASVTSSDSHEPSFFSRFIALLHVESWKRFIGSLLPGLSWFEADVPLQATVGLDSSVCDPASPTKKDGVVNNDDDTLFCQPSQYCGLYQCINFATPLWGANCTKEESTNCVNGGQTGPRSNTRCLGQQPHCSDGYRCAFAAPVRPDVADPNFYQSVFRCKKVSEDFVFTPGGDAPTNQANARCESWRDCASNYKVDNLGGTPEDHATGVWNPDTAPNKPTLCLQTTWDFGNDDDPPSFCCNPTNPDSACARNTSGGTGSPRACFIQPPSGDGSPPFPNTTGGSTGGTPGGTTGGTTATTGGTTGGGTSSAASSANSSANSSATSSRASSASSSRSSSALSSSRSSTSSVPSSAVSSAQSSATGISSSRSSSANSVGSSTSSATLSSSRSSSAVSSAPSSASSISSSRSSSAASVGSSTSSATLSSSRSSVAVSSAQSSATGISSSRSSSANSVGSSTSSATLSSSRSSSAVSSAPSSASSISSSRSSSAASVGSSTSSSALSSSRSSSATSSVSSISSSRSSSAISSSRSSSAISAASSISSSRSSSISSSRSSSAVSSSRSSSVAAISSSRSSSFAMSSSRISSVASSFRSSYRFSSAPSSARYSSANRSSTSSRNSSLNSSIIIAGTSGGTNGGATSGTTSGTSGGVVAGTTDGTTGGYNSSSIINIGPFCGNGAIESGEECDDSNIRDGDGCSSLCLSELGYCGNGKLEYGLGEQCDEGTENGLPTADCDTNCEYVRRAECGDGIVDPLTELCDAGANNGNYAGAPCRENCVLPRCGDGAIDTNEECDDGNNVAGDTCTADCRIQRRAPLDADLIGGTSSGEVPRTIPTPARTQTGPGLVIFLVTGAAVGIGLVRRRLL